MSFPLSARFGFALASLIFALGCSGVRDEALGESEHALEGWGPRADRSCNVVLRSAAVTDGETRGTVDLASAHEGRPWVTWRGADGEWRAVETSPVRGAGRGYRRFAFALGAGTGTGANARVELIPYFANEVGIHYDHNKHRGARDNHVLSEANDHTIAFDGATCPFEAPSGSAEVVLARDWEERVDGTLVRGGKAFIDYDLNRLPQCMGIRYHGGDAWATLAHVKLEPSNAVRTFVVQGPIEIDVPENATRLVTWFSSSGEGCSTVWDSNYGANYTFDVR